MSEYLNNRIFACEHSFTKYLNYLAFLMRSMALTDLFKKRTAATPRTATPAKEVASQAAQPTMEQLVAMLLPKAVLPGWFKYGEASKRFDAYATELLTYITEIYGPGFAFSKSEEGGMIDYIFTRADLEISYTLSRTAHSSESEIFVGNIMLKGKNLDLEQAGKLLNKLTQSDWLLAYRDHPEPRFQIFYTQDGAIVSEGDQLLEKVKVTPTNAIRYLAFPGAIGWAYVDLSKRPDDTRGKGTVCTI